MAWIQANIVNNPFTTSLCIMFTYLGEAILGVVVIGIMYYGYNKKFAKYLGINMLSSCVINPLIKNIFFRVRPYFVNDNIECLKAVDASADIMSITAQGYAFPSGHTMSTMSLFGSIAVYFKKKPLFILTDILVLLVAFSRFALGVHYPTDVIVGAFIGLLVIIIYTLLRKKFDENKIMIVSMILFSVGLFYCKTNDYFQLYGLYLGFAFGCMFESKYVNFKNTNNTLKAIIRLIVGGLLFYGIKEIIKLPFTIDFLESGSYLSLLLTTLRYGLGIFVAMGIYPIIFKYNILKLKEKDE